MSDRIKANIVGAGALGSLLVPAIAAAQVTDLNSALAFITGFINAAIPVLIGIAVLLFIWGVISFITAGDDAEKRSAARNRIIWGIVFIFVILSVWGLVNILLNTFGTGGQAPGAAPPVVPTPPAVP